MKKNKKNNLCKSKEVRAKEESSASVHILSSIGNTFSKNEKPTTKKLIQLKINWEK
jgi:hypothetical protein